MSEHKRAPSAHTGPSAVCATGHEEENAVMSRRQARLMCWACVLTLHIPPDEGVAKVLIMVQMSRPNSYRLMNSPTTRSCMRSVLEKQIVRRTNRLIRVRRLMCLLSIFCVLSFPT